MRRSASQPDIYDESPGLLGATARATGLMILRNPVSVGGSTAFLVALFFVSANALWYQPHAQKSVFFATRDMRAYAPPRMEGEERAAVDRVVEAVSYRMEEDQAPRPPSRAGDPMIEKIQTVLKELELYDGPVDGISGPQTRHAIEEYQRILGLETTGAVDDELLVQLGARPKPARPETTTPPLPKPVPVASAEVPAPAELPGRAAPAATAAADSDIVRVQAGLKAFGNDHIEIDGVVGAQTRAAIREFQSLFGLSVTGEADRELVAKMREIGLIQ